MVLHPDQPRIKIMDQLERGLYASPQKLVEDCTGLELE